MTMSIDTALSQAREFDTVSLFAQRRKGAYRLLKEKNLMHLAFPNRKERHRFTLVDDKPTLPQTWLTPMLECAMK